MSFSDPIIGGTVLRIPAEQSPNFSLAGQTGWAILQNGDAYFFNITASGDITATQFDGTDFEINADGIFFYSGTPATGNLLISIAQAAGTDPYGNSYPTGLQLENGAASYSIVPNSDLVTQTWTTGTPGLTSSTFCLASSTGNTPSGYETIEWGSAHNSTQDDEVVFAISGSSTDGTNRAQITGTYQRPSGGGGINFFSMTFAGLVIAAGSITAVEPGTGTSPTNPAVAETWHTPTLNTGWTVTGASNPVRYRAEPQGCVRIDGEVLSTGAVAANNDVFSLANHWMPAQSHPFITRSDIAVAAGQCTVNVLSSGGVQNGQAFTASGQRLFFDGVVFPLT